MLPPALLPTPWVPLTDPALERVGVELCLKRDDLIHPAVPGNKWRKLTPNLREAAVRGRTRLLAFGGAYSNHLRAVAAAAAGVGMSSVGIVRGEELADRPRNWSLAAAEAAGMRLEFWERGRYREVLGRLDDPAVQQGLADRWGPCQVLPEGGSNALGARGAAAVPAELPDLGPRDLVCCPVGTGGTLAGIAAGLPPGARALGVAVLRGPGYLEQSVERLHQEGWGRSFGNWSIDHDHHCGGYGRVPPELARFAERFEERHRVAVELRYVAKMLRAVHTLAAEGRLPRGTRVTAVVTGPPDPDPG